MVQRESQIKIMFIAFLVFALSVSLAYAVSTTLLSPEDNFVDDDGFLYLRASCTPGYDGTTSFKIISGSLYSNVDGTWEEKNTIQVDATIANSTYFFNFTVVLTGIAEGESKWSVECSEQYDM